MTSSKRTFEGEKTSWHQSFQPQCPTAAAMEQPTRFPRGESVSQAFYIHTTCSAVRRIPRNTFEHTVLENLPENELWPVEMGLGRV